MAISSNALLRKAQKYERDRKWAQAVEAYREALRVDPGNVDAHLRCAVLLRRGGHMPQALEVLQRVVRLAPRRKEGHLELVGLWASAGRFDLALQQAEAAALVLPTEPDVLAARGAELLRARRVDDAAAAAEQALTLDPGHAQAALLAANCDRRGGRLGEARARLDALLARGDVAAAIARSARHELAMVLEALGEHVGAMQTLERWGTETAALPEVRRLDVRALTRRVQGWREVLDERFAARFPAAPADGLPTPAFLVGFPRSGTTMTEQILAAHPGVVASGELPLLLAADKALRGDRPVDRTPELTAQLDAAGVARLREVYWKETRAALGGRDPGGALFLDKLPLNLMDVGLIRALFPGAPVIVALRDPRDVCLSCLMQEFQLNVGMANFLSLERTVAFYAEVMGMWLAVRDALDLRVLHVRYEDTVQDLEGHARRMLEFLDLPWDPAVLAFHEAARERTILTPSREAVTRPVHTGAIGRWRNHEAAFAPHQETLRPFARAFGYGE